MKSLTNLAHHFLIYSLFKLTQYTLSGDSSFNCRTSTEEIEEKASRAKKDEIEHLTGLLKKVLCWTFTYYGCGKLSLLKKTNIPFLKNISGLFHQNSSGKMATVWLIIV